MYLHCFPRCLPQIWYDDTTHGLIIMRHAKREERSLFFLGFPRKEKPPHNGSCEACSVHFFSSLYVSVNIVISHLGRPRSTHTAPTPAPMSSVHAQTITKPSRPGLAVSCSEVVEPGAATCLFRGMAGPRLRSLEHVYVLRTRFKYQ